MQRFRHQLEQANPTFAHDQRRWLFILYDQLSDQIGPLSREDPDSLGIILIESAWKGGRRPYHKMKLAHILANQRHFALEQARRGVAVIYLAGPESYLDQLESWIADREIPIRLAEPAERELRVHLQPLVDRHQLCLIPNESWLTTSEDFNKAIKNPPWRMDQFYRYVRKKYDILMNDQGGYAGGKLSHDHDNREFWPGPPDAPAAPDWPDFEIDEIKREVGHLIARQYAHHPGQLDMAQVVASESEARQFWDFAKHNCLSHFGPYEDAMSTRSRALFHTRISTLMHLGRITPRQAIDDVRQMKLPINSKEGFIRQILGWREFMNHVHRETDGFRCLPDGTRTDRLDQPGEGGYQNWSGQSFDSTHRSGDPDGGAKPSALNTDEPIPAAYWGQPSGLNCLDTVVHEVWEHGWTHHIPRLMVLSNIATLLDISPRELTDWFWVAYIDAFDWVVEPNVLGMGSYGLGDLFVTKPYISGSNYINKMSDYCHDCSFDPKKDCPIGRLYWAFLARHEDDLRGNPRIGRVYATLDRRSPAEKGKDTKTFHLVQATLRGGNLLKPESSGLFSR